MTCKLVDHHDNESSECDDGRKHDKHGIEHFVSGRSDVHYNDGDNTPFEQMHSKNQLREQKQKNQRPI